MYCPVENISPFFTLRMDEIHHNKGVFVSPVMF